MNQLAVFGNPIEHSRSPEIHAAFARQANINLSYEKILVPEGGFQASAESFFAQGGLGCNVTVPCKVDAWELVDEIGADAALAEAVNTISRLPDGRLRGDNTDGRGLVSDLQQNLGWSLPGARILVLGAGGAVSGVIGSLLDQDPELIHVHNRTHATAEKLVSRFCMPSVQPGQLAAIEKAELGEQYDVVINGTSAGLSDQKIALPPSIVGKNTRCYDMVYGNKAFAFLNWSREAGAGATADGLGMLVEQAALAFSIWFRTPVDTAPVIEQLRS